MFLLISVILGLAIGFAMKGSLHKLENLKGLWFTIAALVVTPVLGLMPEIPLVAKAILISFSYMCILLFAFANRKYPLPAALMGVGALANYVVIAANSFRMPVSPKALEFYAGMTAQAVLEKRADYFVATDGARLLFLGDVINIPIPVVGGFISVGDIVLSAGLLLIVAMMMTDKNIEKMNVDKNG